jgi:restriction endonuclease Mrr
MIARSVGVTAVAVYELRRVDSDFVAEIESGRIQQ